MNEHDRMDVVHAKELLGEILDGGEIGQLRADLPFLEWLGDELTRPVQPADAAIDYIPSQ